MVNDRLQQLLDYHDQEPENAFIIYGLALEYRKTNRDKSLFYFNELLQEHPDYLATYYHAAELYHELNMVDQAQLTYQKGISIATAQKDAHALRELKNAYQNFLFEEDLDE